MTERITSHENHSDRNFQTAGEFEYNNPPGVIAEKLAAPSDLNKLLQDFDMGDTEVRDVGRFTENGRRDVINAGRTIFRQGRDPAQVLTANPETINHLNRANEHLRHVLVGDAPYAQPSAGWNFTVNATGFRDAGYEWAQQLDASLAGVLNDATSGASGGGGIDALIELGPGADGYIRQIWSELIVHHPLITSWYLAERSQLSENYQAERFEKEMVQAKSAASRQINTMAREYNLPMEHHNRALQQLHKAKFSAFDHLVSGVDAGDGVLGDYQTGTLRVETKLGGNVANPRDPSDVLGTTSHELIHASSAQAGYRIGLKVEGQGTDINEGMTELLNKLSLDRVRRVGDEMVFIDYVDGQAHRAQIYDTEVKSMYMIKMKHGDSFKTLLHAYYGYAPDRARLREAIGLFNHYAGQIAEIKSRL